MNIVSKPQEQHEPLGTEIPVTEGRFRIRFRLIDLFVIQLVIGLVLAFVVLAVLRARQYARQIGCQNRLKLCALGIHNFHDSFLGIPPLALGDSRASMLTFLLPFTEGDYGGKYLNGSNAAGSTGIDHLMDASSTTPPSNWAALTAFERIRLSTIPWMHCPARRQGNQQIPLSTLPDLYAGPTSDYAVVFLDQDPSANFPRDIPAPDTSPKTGWHLHQNPCDPLEVNRQKGAVRLAMIDCRNPLAPDYRTWKPRDTFQRITDGLSNTLVVGEKHLRSDELLRYSASQDDQDGVYLFTPATGGRNYNVARNIGLPFANGAADRRFVRGQKPAKGPHADFGFGSWHPRVILFAVADGSVIELSPATDEQVKRRYAHVADQAFPTTPID